MKRIIALIRVLSLLIAWDSLGAVGYRAVGNLTWTVYYKGNVFKRVSREFEVRTLGVEWSIRTDVKKGNQAGRYDEAYFDGTNLFSLTKFENAHGGVDDSVGVVELSEVPDFRPSAVSPVWLAFCSGNYLGQRTDGRIAPVWELPRDSVKDPAYPILAKWQFTDSHKSVPKSVVFWNRGQVWDLGGTPLKGLAGSKQATNNPSRSNELIGVNLKAVFHAAPNPFTSGYTNAIYEVLATTNVGSRVLPLHFILTRFGPRRSGPPPSELLTMWTIEGRVMTVSTAEERPRFDPDTSLRTIVTDQRIRKKYPAITMDARYLAQNGMWLTERGLETLPEIKSLIRQVCVSPHEARRA